MWRTPFNWRPLLFAGAVGLSTVPWSPILAAQTTLRAPRAVEWKDFLGVNAQFQYFAPDVYEKQMAALDRLGLSWVRLTTHWAAIEPEPGKYDLTDMDGAMTAVNAHHYNVVTYLVGSAPFASSGPPGASNSDQYPPIDFNAFADRMVMLAKRYPQVSNWQVWNEPNIIWLPQEDPQAYDSLLVTVTNALRMNVPGKNIVAAGMAYYSQMHSTPGLMLEKLLSMGLGNQNIVAAYHPYSEFPEGDTLTDGDFLTRATFINSALHAKGVKQVWATEWGWSSYTGTQDMQHVIGADGQADYVLRRLALMSAMDYQRIFLFNLSDMDTHTTPRDQFYGLLDFQGNPKPAYTALRNFLTITGPRLSPTDAPVMNTPPSDLFAIPWNRADGVHLLMFWSASSSSLQLPGIKSAALLDPLVGTRTVLSDPKGISAPSKSSLQILIWR
ncbi:beta-galactosidase [Pseudomonas sp. NA-150]|uniref:beta-galactosidase n=1 Tax=Pseudomonas sp. NA-150 TaxID=3367525 RepID=UPI0037CBC9F8